jgi:serine/threonine-protein kinase
LISSGIVLQPGRKVGDFELVEELGRGGMGVVYLAEQRSLKRRVALKVIQAPFDPARDQIARFRREAEAVARLSHPNVVQIYEIGEYAGCPFLAMEYVAGSDLGRLAPLAPFTSRRAAEMVETLARTMHAVHEVGIIHRDLKPANVLLTEEGIPKISDFGLARDFRDQGERLTPSEAILGTPAYMAPEQATAGLESRGEIGPWTDVYSLGAVLYKLLTGRAPHSGGTAWETIRQVVSEDPVAPRQLAPSLPRDLETICLKCLEKDRRRRYATAVELAEDLRRFLDGKPVMARPIGSVERSWKWVRRHPALSLLLATTAAAIIGVLIVRWSFQEKLAEERTAFQDQLSSVRQQGDVFANQSFLDSTEWVRSVAQGRFGNPKLLDPQRVKMLQEALERYQGLLPLYAERAAASPQDVGYRALLASTHFNLGAVRMALGLPDPGNSMQQALHQFEQLVADGAADKQLQRAVVECHFNLGQQLARQASYSQALEHFRLAQAAAERLPFELASEELMFRVSLEHGLALAHLGQLAEAGKLFRRLEPQIAKAERNRDATPQQQADAARALYSLGLVATGLGQPSEATRHYDRAGQLQRQLVESYGVNNQYRQDYVHTLANQGQVLWAAGQLPLAEGKLRESVAQAEKLVERVAFAETEFDLGLSTYHLASFLFSQGGDLTEPQALLRRSIERLRRAYEQSPEQDSYRQRAVEAYVGLIMALLARGDHQEAVATVRTALPLAPKEPNHLVSAARFVARAMELAARDTILASDDRPRKLAEYGDLAMQLLHQAVQLGVSNPAGWKDDPTLAPLRDRADFQSLGATSATKLPVVPLVPQP